MKRSHRGIILTLFLVSALVSACGIAGTPSSTPAPSPTPDPCSPDRLPDEAAKVSTLMREFDDGSFVAQYTPSSQLGQAISELQRIRRDAEDQDVPSCLARLKQLQLQHMNAVIVTLAILMDPSTPPELVNQGIGSARQLHDEYETELARLLGVTLVPPATVTPGPSPTPAANATPSEAPTISAAIVINPGPTTLNLRVEPALEAATLGILDVGQSAPLLGRTADGLWFQIQIPDRPDQTAWVYAQLVQASVDASAMPILTPPP